jgi:hypothetical protein
MLEQQQHSSNGNTIQLILIRHGIALHNVMHHHYHHHPQQHPGGGPPTGFHRNAAAAAASPDEYYLFDPSLTVDGKIQAIRIGESVRQFLHHQQQQQHPQHYRRKLDCEIVSSPLTRCLQTAMYAFGIPQDYDTTTTFSATTDTPTSSTTAATRANIYCHENLREACGVYHWDRRRTRTQLQQVWGHMVQFIQHDTGDGMSDHDTLWHSTHRETIFELQCRITRFMTWLLSSSSSQRSQQTKCGTQGTTTIYILVTHGVWIETMLQMYDPTWSSQTAVVDSGGPRRIHNADVYYTECIYTTTTTTVSNATAVHPTPLNTAVYHIRLQNVQQISTPYSAR